MVKKTKSVQKQRTKGNVKPSSSEKAANFLLQKTGSLTGGLSFPSGTQPSLGDASFIKLSGFVPLEHGTDSTNIDGDIRMHLRKLDKRDAITKQKTLIELIPLLDSEKPEDAVLSALPYWPRIYARLAMDEDRKVRELAQKALGGFTSRCGKNIAPYLKQLLPTWIISQCDLFEPAAMAAENAFATTFPAHKQKDAYLHSWEDIFALIEDTLNSVKLNPGKATGDDSKEESEESYYIRTVVACIRTLTKLLNYIGENEKAVERLSSFLHEKQFWRHTKDNLSLLNAAYYQLISGVCQQFPKLAQACCVQFCEVTLRHVDDDSPVTVTALWEALLNVLVTIEDVWKFVSFKKSFLPKVMKVLEQGGNGCARHIHRNMLPLFSKLPLCVSKEEDIKVYFNLLSKMIEGLYKDRVLVSSLDANAVASAVFECTRYLISETLKVDATESARYLVDEIVAKVLEEALCEVRAKNFCESVYRQASLLMNYLFKNSRPLHESFRCHITGCLTGRFSDPLFCSNFVTFVFYFTNCESDVTKMKKQVSFEDSDACPAENTSSSVEEWKESWLIEFHNILESKISQETPHCIMPYFCISTKLPDQARDSTRSDKQLAILKMCQSLLTEENLHGKLVCKIIGRGMANIVQNLSSADQEIRIFFLNLSNAQAVLFLSKLFPWIIRETTLLPVKESILLALEHEIIAWNKNLLRKVLVNLDNTLQKKLKTLLKVTFNFTEELTSLHNVRTCVINEVAECLHARPRTMTPEQRSLSADTLLFFVDCLQLCAVDLETCEPFILTLASFYLDYLSFDAKPDSPNPVEDDGAYMWSKVHDLICKFYRSWLETEFDSELKSPNFVTQLFDNILTSISDCTRKDGSLELKTFGNELMDISLGTACTTKILLHCFSFVDAGLSSITLKMEKNAKYNCELYHTGYPEFMAFVKVLSFLLVFVSDKKYDVDSAVPDFWLPYVIAASLTGSLSNVETADNNDTCDQIRNFVLLDLCVNRETEILDLLDALSKRNFSNTSFQKSLVSRSVKSFRHAFLFCIPTKQNEWPDSLTSDVHEISAAWNTCDLEGFSMIVDVFIPLAVNCRCLVKEDIVASLHRALTEPDVSTETVTRVLLVINSLVQSDGGYVYPLFPIIMTLKDNRDLIIDDIDDLDDTNEILKTTIQFLRIVHKAVSFCPEDLNGDQWEYILCSISSLISLVLCDMTSLFMSDTVAGVLAYHVLNLIAAAGTAIPLVRVGNISSEWEDFHCSHIFEALLPATVALFEQELESPSEALHDVGFVREALCAAMSVCPQKQLLENELKPRLFADDPVRLPINLHTFVNTLCPLVLHEKQSVQLSTYFNLMNVADDVAKHLEKESELEEIDIPLAFTRNLSTFTSSGLYNKIRASGLGSVSHVIRNVRDNHSTILGYFLSWRIVLEVFKSSTSQSKAKFATFLIRSETFDQLMHCLLRVMPPTPVTTLRETLKATNTSRPLTNTVNLFEDEPIVFDTCSDYRSAAQLQHLACNLFRRILEDAPALARQWWLSQNKMIASHMEKYTERFVTPFLCRVQIEEVNRQASQASGENNSLIVKGRPAVREIVVIYNMSEEHSTEMVILMPVNYPLGPVSVETGRKVGVTIQQWRGWLLQLTIFLQNQNGSVLEGIQLWKRNVDKKFEGMEECMVCYSVIHGTSFSLPKMQCKTCKKRFHYDCMVKWFSTSQKPTCPLCRSLFDMPHAVRRTVAQQGIVLRPDDFE